MGRRVVWSVRLLLALPVAACAADPGFYVGATASRVEQDLDERAGVGPIAVLVAGGGGLVTPSPILPFPPVFITPIVGGIANPLGPTSVKVDDTDVGWSVSLGYRINKYLAAEVAYADFGEASLTERYEFDTLPGVPVVPQMTRSYTVSTQGPALSVLGSLPLGSAWEVFLRGGVLFADQEVKTRITIINPRSTSNGGTAGDFSDEVVTLGAGVQWSFLPRWTARLEYQRTDDLQPNELMGESSLEQASLSVLFKL